MKKLFVLALVCISILCISVSALAARSDRTEDVICTKCKETAVLTTCFSQEITDDWEERLFDGKEGYAWYIRFYNRVPTIIDCKSCDYYHEFFTYYWTDWELMGRLEKK